MCGRRGVYECKWRLHCAKRRSSRRLAAPRRESPTRSTRRFNTWAIACSLHARSHRLDQFSGALSRRTNTTGPRDRMQPESTLKRVSRKSASMEYLVDNVPAALERSLDGVGRVATIASAMKQFSHPGSDGFGMVFVTRFFNQHWRLLLANENARQLGLRVQLSRHVDAVEPTGKIESKKSPPKRSMSGSNPPSCPRMIASTRSLKGTGSAIPPAPSWLITPRVPPLRAASLCGQRRLQRERVVPGSCSRLEPACRGHGGQWVCTADGKLIRCSYEESQREILDCAQPARCHASEGGGAGGSVRQDAVCCRLNPEWC